MDWSAIEKEAAQLLSRYLQLDTTNPPGNEADAIAFLADTLRDLGFEPRVIPSGPNRANLITRLPAPNGATAPPCLLYTHADVVPANPADWAVPPFSGQIKDGYVWGRGALDNKGMGVIFLQALALLKQQAPPLKRDIILLVGADEEACGHYGVAWLMKHHPELIQAEYVWDEGGVGLRRLAPPNHYLYQIAVAEKGSLVVKLTAHGTPGHAAIPQANNAPERLVQALHRVKAWSQPTRLTPALLQMLPILAPDQSFPRSFLFALANSPFLQPLLSLFLEKDPFFMPLTHNTVSLTILRSGQKNNVIPAQAEAKLDIRLLPDESPAAILADLKSIINDPNITIVAEETPIPQVTAPTNTPFYQALTQTLQTLGPPGLALPYLTPGATDSRFFRQAGMKAYGFMPMLLDSHELNRIHAIDERVSLANLRWGIQFVFETLQKLA